MQGLSPNNMPLEGPLNQVLKLGRRPAEGSVTSKP